MKFVMRTQDMFCLFVATLLSIWLFPFATDGFAHSGEKQSVLREEETSPLMAIL